MEIVALVSELVNDILKAEETFYANPKDMYNLECSVKGSTDMFAKKIIEFFLDEIDKRIRADAYRKDKYIIQRTDKRTLITTVGDVTFNNTYYQSKEDGSFHYLTEETIGLAHRERFSDAAECAMIQAATRSSYEEATKILPSKSKITKTTVMNKVHSIAEEVPLAVAKEKRSCAYLFIEADEDHIHQQHGRISSKETNKGFISRLAYVYEENREVGGAKNRKELVGAQFFSGLYPGKEGIRKFWKKIEAYIVNTYVMEDLKQIYILGDGAQWIKSGATYLEKALFCADKFHLMKYINAASKQLLDESEEAKAELYRLLYHRDKPAFIAYTNRMLASAENPEPITNLQTFVVGNWSAVMRTYHNKHIYGCSAEGHVSHMLSARMSSRPMGWSYTGADRMSKLRCFIKNEGAEKMLDLIQYSRKVKYGHVKEPVEFIPNIRLQSVLVEHYKQCESYIERIQASIPGITAMKSAAIRLQLRLT